jgi:GH15 family glucan-1,4-alpha-glucosidase
MSTEQAKIHDYAVIGDGRSAALISNRGSMDWLCWPRFDSPSIFAAILDPKIGGQWSIQPWQDFQTTRRYIDNTNVLEIEFTTASGKIVLTDFMPVASEEQKQTMLWPEQELIRYLRCEEGEVEMRIHFDPRPDYGRAKVRFDNAGKLGFRIEIGRGTLILRSDLEFALTEESLAATVRLRAGEAIAFSLSFSREAPAVIPALGELVQQKLDLTIDWWRQWAGRATYRGAYRDEVIRSALVLKLLSFAPSGALAAAPTTSLPEKIGGPLNWDYRFCWLRDAAFTVRALFGLGYPDDADAFTSWLLHATRLTRPRLSILYDVYGELTPPEKFLDHFAGYAGSRPVRIGNQAATQIQLDVYGEVIEAVSYFSHDREKFDRDTQQMLKQFGEYVHQHWCEPDYGIWEYRESTEHYTHSRLLCWVALDCLIDMQERHQLHGLPIDKWRETRSLIRRDIEEHAWNPTLGSYTQLLGGDELDATALLLALHNFEDPASERMRQTHARIRERLAPAPGVIYRDEKSKARGEGGFALCSFWEVDYLARGGATLAEAHEAFKHVAKFANDVGLFAEQISPETGDALGNFPQGFTHLGLINAALSLDRREKHERMNGAHNNGAETKAK